jgi:putative ABC transport system permease protein
MLSKDFLRLVLIASLIAFPLAIWITNQWLNNFAYRISVSWWMLIAAGVIAVVIALITISFKAIKAAIANPVKSLRSE